MSEKVLMLASTASMIQQFNMDNIEILQELGYEVEVACNFYVGNTCTPEKVEELKRDLDDAGVAYHQVDFARNPIHVGRLFQAYLQVKCLCQSQGYEFIHCHTPIGSVVSRMAGHSCHIPVMYTAHGFHFYKGAPIQNWLLYYPVEKFFARWTKTLVTITDEDYKRAKKKLRANEIKHIHGIGVDLDYYNVTDEKREKIRKYYRRQLRVKDDEYMLFSVGELNNNKNHETILEVLHEIHDEKLKYFICGIGPKKEYYERIVSDFGMADQITFLGFRDDLRELYITADLFVFPSKREGLSVALMEAVASKTPTIASNIRGNNELIVDNNCRFEATDKEQIKKMILDWRAGKLIPNPSENYRNLNQYSKKNVHEEMKRIYSNV
ncbi:MAG: glycosyltransferase [Lachnospiraceae bacterium]|nr:glycosyltransferase [Lachnospiraceae bacterium]